VKTAAILGQIWGIGKRRDWDRRLWLFDRLVWTVMGYGNGGKNMGLEGKRRVREVGEEILEMGAGGGRKDAVVLSKRGVTVG